MFKQTESGIKHDIRHEKTTLVSYVVGFALSLLFTLLAYWLVVNQLTAGWVRTGAILGIGFLQAIVQLIFFLHLTSEPKPRWNLYALLFMLMVLIIIVVGSIWVMANLDYRMMPQM